jgi:hypothetical protein
MALGRPKLAVTVTRIQVHLSLREGEDDDLIEAFRTVPRGKRSAFIKSAMRSGGLQVVLDDLPEDEELLESLDNFLS